MCFVFVCRFFKLEGVERSSVCFEYFGGGYLGFWFCNCGEGSRFVFFGCWGGFSFYGCFLRLGRVLVVSFMLSLVGYFSYFSESR